MHIMEINLLDKANHSSVSIQTPSTMNKLAAAAAKSLQSCPTYSAYKLNKQGDSIQP